MQTIVKNILIIGQDSYIGTRFAAYASDIFTITTADARENRWQFVDMSVFDTVLHVSGIAHVKQKRKMKSLYEQVNCNLPVEAAKKAKSSGVRQFIFLSSMAVYGKIPSPNDYYGNSKWKAEQALQDLSSPDFTVCIIRPPMVYGPGCKGNFPKLVKLAKSVPLFPKIENRRSMIYIDNLCQFLCIIMKENFGGLHHPQNKEYINTTRLVQLIAALHGKKIRTTRLFNPLIHLLAKNVPSINKLFGSLTYKFNGDEAEYNIIDYEESVRISVCTNK
jgi:UDP-glucose 4-epimerase